MAAGSALLEAHFKGLSDDNEVTLDRGFHAHVYRLRVAQAEKLRAAALRADAPVFLRVSDKTGKVIGMRRRLGLVFQMAVQFNRCNVNAAGNEFGKGYVSWAAGDGLKAGEHITLEFARRHAGDGFHHALKQENRIPSDDSWPMRTEESRASVKCAGLLIHVQHYAEIKPGYFKVKPTVKELTIF